MKFERRVVREEPGVFSREWKHFDTLRKGDLIARYNSGREVLADRDGCILFPTSEAEVDDAWFYVGSDKGFFTV